MKRTNIAVIIVSFKTALLTIESLHTVFKERSLCPELNINAIIVDNASGDSEEIHAAIIENQWANWATLITTPENGGFGYGNNVGFKHALDSQEVDFFHLLNPDAQLKPNALSTLVNFFKSRPDAGIAGSSFVNSDGSLWPIAFRFPTIYGEFDSGINWGLITKLLKKHSVAVHMKQILQPIDWIAGASMMIRCDVVESLKGFDESYFLYYEETDFCLRAKRAGISTWYVPESMVMHIAGQSTKVTERNAKPKRFPNYWYESRRMYYMKNHGLVYAITTDICTILANFLGNIKRGITGKSIEKTPHFIEDIFKNSPIFPSNRKLKPFHSQLKE